MSKVHNSVTPSAVHHRQNPLEFVSTKVYRAPSLVRVKVAHETNHWLMCYVPPLTLAAQPNPAH
jgi:hypothetical protein